MKYYYFLLSDRTSMSVLFIVGPKCRLRWPRRTLPSGESWWACRRDRQTDGQTSNRQTVIYAVLYVFVDRVAFAIGAQRGRIRLRRWYAGGRFTAPPPRTGRASAANRLRPPRYSSDCGHPELYNSSRMFLTFNFIHLSRGEIGVGSHIHMTWEDWKAP